MKQISNFYTDSPALTLTIQDIKKLFFSLSLPKLSSFSNITVDGIFLALNPRPRTCYEFLNHIFTSFRNLTTEQRYNKQFGKNFTKETKCRTWVLTICQKISEIPTEH